MVRTKKIFRKDILEGAYELVLAEGFEHFHARNVAKQLNCSTQPIYREFSNLTELKDALIEKITENYRQFLATVDIYAPVDVPKALQRYAAARPKEFIRFFIEEPTACVELKNVTMTIIENLPTAHLTVEKVEVHWEHAVGYAALYLYTKPRRFTEVEALDAVD
jgi:AcrR family transcriptional regulator